MQNKKTNIFCTKPAKFVNCYVQVDRFGISKAHPLNSTGRLKGIAAIPQIKKLVTFSNLLRYRVSSAHSVLETCYKRNKIHFFEVEHLKQVK